jgi:alpha-N-arabinofuranosidase
MEPEYYSDLYRRFATYLREFGDNELYKIACGARNEDYDWTETLMRKVTSSPRRGRMNGLSLHYYTRVRNFLPQMQTVQELSNSATEFGELEWFAILHSASFIDEIVRKHGNIMDKYDPDKEIGMIVDEWGTWYSVEPDTNPRFLYQQNSLRDALVAGLTLNIFNQHADRVRMANIAQTVNVLQTVILTRGEEMILTPTYHVFEMYKVHQGGTLLPIHLETIDYRFGNYKMPALNASASRDSSGKVHISICNLDPHNAVPLVSEIRGIRPVAVSGRVLTADDMTAHNTFSRPDHVIPRNLADLEIVDNQLAVTLPAMSVVVMEIR